MRRALWVLYSSALAMGGLVTPALAQAPEDQGIDSQSGAIVVTAQRREQNLQDVPLAVSAISEEALLRQEAISTQGLLRLFPNVSGAQITGAGANNYSIRGLSNAETAATFDSPVGTYIDGIYLARVNANNFALFDIERVEILRGPQGTLFGRNTTGGAVNIVLKKPSSEFGGMVEGSYGTFDSKMVRGAIDVPLSDSIRTRIAGYWMEEDGWVKNITTGGTENDHDGWGVRGAVSIDLTPNLTWDVAVDYIKDENSNIPQVRIDGEWTSSSGLQPLGDLVANDKGDIEGNRVFNDTLGVTSTLSLDASIGTINFITGYRDLKTEFNLDYFNGPTAIGAYDSVQDSRHKQFTQELNISGEMFNGLANFTAGLFYFNEDNKTDFTTLFRLGSGFPFIDADRIVFNTTKSLAIYSQIDWHLSESLTLTTGGRWTADTKKIDYLDNNNPRAAAKLTNDTLINAGIPLTQSDEVFTPRIALTYQMTPDVMVFASATKGFKSGGWNVRATTANLLGDFGKETIWSYEAGLRSEFLDRRVTFNLTGFYGDTKGLQIATAAGAAVTTAPVFPVGNFSDFRSYGLEAELNVAPTDGLSIFANAGYNKTKYVNPTDAVLAQQSACLSALAAGMTSSNCGNGIVRPDGGIAEPLRAPEFTGTLGFSWVVPVTASWAVVPAGSVRYVSSFNANAAELPSTEDNGYTLVAGSVALENQDAGLRLSVGCENCTDTNYLVSVIGGFRYVSPPRRWTVRARFEF